MNKTTRSSLLTLILIIPLSLIGIPTISLALPSSSTIQQPMNLSLNAPYPRDLSIERIGEDEIAIRKLAAEVGSDIATGASPIGQPATVGDEISITVSDDGLGIEYNETFVVLMGGTHGIILIEKAAYNNYDPVMDAYIFPNPYHIWRDNDTITSSQLGYLLNEFDNNIYPTDTNVFGEPLPRGQEGQKVWILIHNIRDEAYYVETDSYIAGYFSASEDAENNKNMMHIDSYDWINRVGPDGTRPFLYEGVFAHEFEHLIHFDQDPDEPSWVDEGLADLAGYLCGYGHPDGHLMYYMAFHQITALTFWGNNLEDYGASYLFQLYLYEKYGGLDFVSALVQEQANGIVGIENTLRNFGYKATFDYIFDCWTIANYYDDTSLYWGQYGYDLLEIGGADTRFWTIEYALGEYWEIPIFTTPLTISSNWFYGIEPQPYTAQYYRFTNEKLAKIIIDGDDYAGVPAYSGTYEWYSGADAWAWRGFSQTFDIPIGGATLNFNTYYDIEENWDYGYVEVYDYDTGEWYTLDAPGTVDYVAFAQDNPNTPVGREPMDYEAAGRWHGFTGSSGGWIPVSMDLSAFGGHTIALNFRTWQDGAFTLQMMYVDDILIPEIGFSDDVESGEGDWLADGWYITDGILDNGLSVTTVSDIHLSWFGGGGFDLYFINHMRVNSETQQGRMSVLSTTGEEGDINLAIVSNRADHILTSHYEMTIQEYGWKLS